MTAWPIAFADVEAARERLRPHLPKTPLRAYAALDEALGTGIRAFVEGAGAAGLAGLVKLRETLAGKTVGIVLSGANIDQHTLARVLTREL